MSHIAAYRRPTALLVSVSALLAGCEPVPGPRTPPGEAPVPADAVEDAPIRLEYVCGNRFVIINAHPRAVTVRYQVQGTEERGERRLPPATAGDPPFSEVQVTVGTEGPVAARDVAVGAVDLACSTAYAV